MIHCCNWHAFSLASASALALLLAAGHSAANPTGPTVVNGTATFSTSGNALQITNSPNVIINWQSVSIPLTNTTRFIQQSSTSAVLNRVISSNSSMIYGALQSNGQVFIVNPNGVYFGASAQVSTASLTVTTGQFSDASFLSGSSFPADGAMISISGPFTISGPLSLWNSSNMNGNVSLGSIATTGGNIVVAGTGTVAINGNLSTSGGNLFIGSTGDNAINGITSINVPVLATAGTVLQSGNITTQNTWSPVNYWSSGSGITVSNSGAAVTSGTGVTLTGGNIVLDTGAGSGRTLNITAGNIASNTVTAGTGISLTGGSLTATATGSSGNSGTNVSISGSTLSTVTTGTPAASVIHSAAAPAINTAAISGSSSARSTSANASATPASPGAQGSADQSASPTPIAHVVLQKREPLY